MAWLSQVGTWLVRTSAGPGRVAALAAMGLAALGSPARVLTFHARVIRPANPGLASEASLGLGGDGLGHGDGRAGLELSHGGTGPGPDSVRHHLHRAGHRDDLGLRLRGVRDDAGVRDGRACRGRREAGVHRDVPVANRLTSEQDAHGYASSNHGSDARKNVVPAYGYF